MVIVRCPYFTEEVFALIYMVGSGACDVVITDLLPACTFFVRRPALKASVSLCRCGLLTFFSLLQGERQDAGKQQRGGAGAVTMALTR